MALILSDIHLVYTYIDSKGDNRSEKPQNHKTNPDTRKEAGGNRRLLTTRKIKIHNSI